MIENYEKITLSKNACCNAYDLNIVRAPILLTII